MSGMISGLLTGQNSGQLGQLPQGSAQTPPQMMSSQGMANTLSPPAQGNGVPYYLAAPGGNYGNSALGSFAHGFTQGLQGLPSSGSGFTGGAGGLVGGLMGGSPGGQRLGSLLKIVGLL